MLAAVNCRVLDTCPSSSALFLILKCIVESYKNNQLHNVVVTAAVAIVDDIESISQWSVTNIVVR